MTKRKLNFRTHNDLQVSHVISIFPDFKTLSQKEIYKMMHFVFKTLKVLTLEFQFWKILGGTCPPSPPPPAPPSAATALLLQTLVQTVMQIFYVLFFIFW